MRLSISYDRRLQIALFLLFILGHAGNAQPQPISAHVNVYFAQIADGQFEGGRWQSSITLVNHNGSEAAAEIRLYGSDGGPFTVDFGSGLASRFQIRVPANGSLTLASRPTSLPVRSGWAFVDSNLPLTGSASYRLWLGGRAVQEVTAPPTLPVIEYVSYANRDLGVAVANPRNWTVRVEAYLKRADGVRLGPSLITLPPYGHTAFNVRDRFPAADSSNSVLLLTAANPPEDLFIAWTMNADPSGTFSSLPPGNVIPPISHWDRIWNVYLRVLHAARTMGFISSPSPRLTILYDRQVNAHARGGTDVGIYMGLSELLGDSDSELAYVVGHELGHIIQQRAGGLRVWHPSNGELDADVWGALFSLASGFDAYAAAGALSKLSMATGTAGLLTQLFEDLIPVADAHRSFNTRMGTIYEFFQFLCSPEVGQRFCRDYKRIMHPHLPDSAPLNHDEFEKLGFRRPAEIPPMMEALRARLNSAEQAAGEPPRRDEPR